MGIIQDKPIKKSQYIFCKNIFTPQTYGIEEKQKKYIYKPYKKYNKRYFLKRSTTRIPYLDPNRHVKKYNPKIWFIFLSLFFFEDQLKYLFYMFIRQDMRKC